MSATATLYSKDAQPYWDARHRFNDAARRWATAVQSVEALIASAKLNALTAPTDKERDLWDDMAKRLEEGFSASAVMLAREKGREATVNQDAVSLKEAADALEIPTRAM